MSDTPDQIGHATGGEQGTRTTCDPDQQHPILRHRRRLTDDRLDLLREWPLEDLPQTKQRYHELLAHIDVLQDDLQAMTANRDYFAKELQEVFHKQQVVINRLFRQIATLRGALGAVRLRCGNLPPTVAGWLGLRDGLRDIAEKALTSPDEQTPR